MDFREGVASVGIGLETSFVDRAAGFAAECLAEAANVLDLNNPLGFRMEAGTAALRRRPAALDPTRLARVEAFATRDWIPDVFTLVEPNEIRAAGSLFLAGVDLAGFTETLEAIFFLRTFSVGVLLVCGCRLIGGGVTFRGLTAGFKGTAFAARATALDGREELTLREVGRTREAALLLPALAVRNLPFFIAIVSPPVGCSETEHYGRMRVFAIEFPNRTNAVMERESVAAGATIGYSQPGSPGG